MKPMDETELVQKTKELLDGNLLEIDGATTSRLDAARYAALDQLDPGYSTAHADPLIQKARQILNDSAVDMDKETAARLDQIRARAISSKSETSAGNLRRFIATFVPQNSFSMSASMFATACVLVAAVSLFYVNPNSTSTLSLDEEISLIDSADDLELYENLDFYLWLAENGLPN